MILPRASSILVEWLFLLGTLAALATVARSLHAPRRRHLPVLALVVALWSIAFWQFRIRTGFGVAVFGGASHWIATAAEAKTDSQAAAILREVLLSSNYGVDAAEVAVLRREDPAERRRLFDLLARVVPWDHWKATFAARRDG